MTTIGEHAPRCNAIGKQKKRLFVDLFPTAVQGDNAVFSAVVQDAADAELKMASFAELYGADKIKLEQKDGQLIVTVNCVCNRPAYKANGKCYVHGGKTRNISALELKKLAAKAGTKHGAYARKVAINTEGIMYCEFCRAKDKCTKSTLGDCCWYEKTLSDQTWSGFKHDLGTLSEADTQLISELISILIKKFRYNKYLNFSDLVEEKTWIHPKTGKPIQYDKLAVGLAHIIEFTPQIISIMRELKATRAIREPEPTRHEFIFQMGKKEELTFPESWKEQLQPEENIIDVDYRLQEEEKKNSEKPKTKVKVKRDDEGKVKEVEITEEPESDFVWSDT